MTPATESTSRRPRLLYVEDEPGVAMITQELLEMEGFEVEHAANGRAALDQFNRDPRRFDVVLTDDAMPEVTGVQLTERLRESGFTGPIVVYSGVVDNTKARAYRSHGVTAIIHKLDPLDHLLGALRAAATPKS